MRILNFSRGELVNDTDIIAALGSGVVNTYITDFPSARLLHVPGVIPVPHLGASTPESEDNCAVMAVKQTKDFPVGIFTTCDFFGYGLTVAAKNLNLEVGKDVFIIGVDDQIWSKDIGLTTLKQPVEEMSQFAAEILLNKINKTEGYQEIVRKKFESVLIKRDSA